MLSPTSSLKSAPEQNSALQDARNLLPLALSGLAEAADEDTLQTAGAAEYFCRYDLPQYLSVLRAAMDALDKVQQGMQEPAATDKA